MSELLSERTGTTLTLTLNRPEKMNALSASLVEALLAAVEPAQGEGVRLLVLRGIGRNFSAGFDFGGVDDQSEGDLVLRFARIEQLLQTLHHAPFETLALAHGKNFGAGVDLVGACATRIATADASFRMPGLNFGLVLGTRRFASQVGADSARAILRQAKTFGTSEASRIGFIHRAAEQTEWPAAIHDAEAAAQSLSADTSARLSRALRADTRDADLADLVRSASQPGLKARIAAYLAPRQP
jgi:enoyl-CoA hydratase/carnithine racemase